MIVEDFCPPKLNSTEPSLYIVNVSADEVECQVPTKSETLGFVLSLLQELKTKIKTDNNVIKNFLLFMVEPPIIICFL